MKIDVRKIMGITGIFIFAGIGYGISSNKDTKKMEKELIVCKLNGAEFQKRKKDLQLKIISKVTGHEELSNGVALKFDAEPNFEIMLADYILTERKCCPFFTFNYIFHPHDQGIELHMTGNQEVKSMLISMLQHMGLKL